MILWDLVTILMEAIGQVSGVLCLTAFYCIVCSFYIFVSPSHEIRPVPFHVCQRKKKIRTVTQPVSHQCGLLMSPHHSGTFKFWTKVIILQHLSFELGRSSFFFKDMNLWKYWRWFSMVIHSSGYLGKTLQEACFIQEERWTEFWLYMIFY